MRFEWDDAKAARNLAKHGVAFHEAGTVFGDTLGWTYPDPTKAGGERRWITIGMSDRQRLLVVVHADRSRTIRIISAREATRQEKRFYENG